MDDEENICEGCGKVYYPAGAWIHAKCENEAVVGNGLDRVSDTKDTGRRVEGDVLQDDGGVDKRKQRWTRKDYNAYQREYMRKWRKK